MCDSEANVWTTGDDTQSIMLQWTFAGGGSIDTETLPLIPEYLNTLAFASDLGSVSFNDRWNVARTTSSSGTTSVHGAFAIARTNATSAVYGIDFAVQVGSNLDGNGEPQTWETVFSVLKSEGDGPGGYMYVSWSQWEDYYGPYLASYGDYIDFISATYEFDFIVQAGQVVRVVGSSQYALDVVADDNQSVQDDHYLGVILELTVIDP